MFVILDWISGSLHTEPREKKGKYLVWFDLREEAEKYGHENLGRAFSIIEVPYEVADAYKKDGRM